MIRERLEREFGLDLIATAPNVVYRVVMEDRSEHIVTNPSEFPEGKIDEVYEPVVRATILAPSEFIGSIMELCQTRRGTLLGMDYLSEDRVEIRVHAAARRDRLRLLRPVEVEDPGSTPRSTTSPPVSRPPAWSRSTSCCTATRWTPSRDHPQGRGVRVGVRLVAKLRELIPRQAFEVPIQAAIGSRVIARETIRAIRKDVLAKCFGGDISRKRKLLEKQKEGKKRMKMVGSVEVPQEAFIAVLSSDDSGGSAKESPTCYPGNSGTMRARRASARRAGTRA